MSAPTNPARETPPRHAARARRRGPSNVVLVGLSGSGKSTVGRLLARRLGWRFVDTDHEIRRRTGSTVEAIFQVEGEPAFRAVESAVLEDVCSRAHQVIATGGGAVIDRRNRETMLDGNLVVWLEGSPEVLASRLARSVSREPRPLLAGGDLLERLSALGRDRERLYSCAHRTMRTDGQTPREVAESIAEVVRGH